MVWKFGHFEEGLSGVGSTIRAETFVSQLAFLQLPDSDKWFVKMGLLGGKLLACGNQVGDIYIWKLDQHGRLPSAERQVALVEGGMSPLLLALQRLLHSLLQDSLVFNLIVTASRARPGTDSASGVQSRWAHTDRSGRGGLCAAIRLAKRRRSGKMKKVKKE